MTDPQLNPPQLSPADEAELARCFGYHPPLPDSKVKFEALTEAMLAAARAIFAHCPPGPDREAALVALRSARMWANAAIACRTP